MTGILLKSACLVLLAVASTSVPAQRPADGFGPDDTVGAVNLIDGAKTRAAADLVTDGRVYALGVVTGRDTPAYPGRSFSIEIFGGPRAGSNAMTGHDDRLETHIGIGSQIDGLAHIGRGGVHYNGHRAEDIFAADGLRALGTEHIPPIATRGVMIDMAAHFGVERLAPLQPFGRADIEAAAEAQDVMIGTGDVVLFHTGWLTMATEDAEVFIGQQPGIDVEGARYLAELGVVAIGADSAALETLAFQNGELFPVHQMLLVDYGVYVLETINTHDLAADDVHEFMFVLGQPRYAGSVQAVINPVAIR
ncbi:MAG: cyclase family protein [Sphingomonadaceae bacterium]|nr:cyclase family protein [Sphingomonadaceae bacterium]